MKYVFGLISFILIMILVAFFILSERKILSYIQLRKGPNKVGICGLLQSFSDLIKLVGKVSVLPTRGRSWYSLVGLAFLFIISFGMCVMHGMVYVGLVSDVWILWFLVLSSIFGYCVLSAGWGSYNKYAMLGSIRLAFCSVTFEACMMCVVLILGLVLSTYNVYELLNYSWFIGLVVPVCYLIWLIGMLCETNRTPFDYGESESELVSGLNVEYGGLPFICLFACEYLMIYVFSWLSSLLFFGGNGVIMVLSLLHVVYFIWVRGTFPRVRYDYFVDFMWSYCLLLMILSIFIVF